MKNEVRPIDANALAKRIREHMDNFPYAGTRLATCRVVLSMLGDEGQTPTLKDHFPEVRKMMPIALDQLKAMNEKVVFVQIVKKDFSSVCDLKSQHGIVKPSEGRIKLFNGRSVFFPAMVLGLPTPTSPPIVVVDELEESERGDRGFGSTGR